MNDEVVRDRIKEARKAAKMTQKELADKTGIPVSTIQKYENGIFTPKIDKLLSIADALGVPLFYFGDFPGSIEEARAHKAAMDEETRIEDAMEELVKTVIHADSVSFIEAGDKKQYIYYRFVTESGVKVLDERAMGILTEVVKSTVETFMNECTFYEEEYFQVMKDKYIPFYLYNSDQK